jgi:hypothetical protein
MLRTKSTFELARPQNLPGIHGYHANPQILGELIEGGYESSQGGI